MLEKREEVLEELKSLLTQKRSKEWYAEKLGVTLAEAEDLIKECKGVELKVIDSSEVTIKHNLEKGTVEVNAYYEYPPSEAQVTEDHQIDTKLYKLSSFWSKGTSKGWLVSAFFSKIAAKEEFADKFSDFISNYQSSHKQITNINFSSKLEKGCLILNHQDAHLNEYDINGANNISDRFDKLYNTTVNTINKAKVTNKIEKIIYVIGSDCFNSEWTGTTTKGTIQQNILTYDKSFQLICDFQTKVIDTLLHSAVEVEVVFIPGNHDQYVGFHMVSWLEAYYRNQKNLAIDISTDFTKYRQYSNTAMCFNHGDVQKPATLAQNFPVQFKHGWATSDHYIVYTGDKHSELAKSFGAIKFYQLPALALGRSSWSSKQGYITPPEMVSFLITEGKGLTSIFKEVL